VNHDELLALINDEIEVCEPECNQHQRINAPWLALRAVVELHKPKYWENIYDPSWNGNNCSICFTDGNLEVPSSKITYPCPTIQTIEKELA